MNQSEKPSFLHPLDTAREALPTAFTYPFRYTPHPLCRRAARIVQDYVEAEGLSGEGKMYGVLVVEGGFLAAYSGQLAGSYAHPWFVPPVFDYLDPESYFQKEQTEISTLSVKIENAGFQASINTVNVELERLFRLREEVVDEAGEAYERGKKERDDRRAALDKTEPDAQEILTTLERESQFQKAEIRRAKQQFATEIKALEQRLDQLREELRRAKEERRQRSEALQDWLFRQFRFMNARGETKSLPELFGDEGSSSPAADSGTKLIIPSGAGECCAPKLLNAAYALGLRPLAMAEFWWGPALCGNYRRAGVFYPSCNRKCRPILSFMLEGLNVEPDPARHYERLGGELQVVWQDAWMAVVVKPTGWLSVPGKSDVPNVLDEARRRWPDISGPVVVHRLDQDTSGLMILAKTQMSYSWLQKQFEARAVKKRYVALLEGQWRLTGLSGQISLPLAPDFDYLPRQRVDRERGLEAVTLYEVIGNEMLNDNVGETEEAGGRAVTRIAFYPQTGRTHQLRVHASSDEGLAMPIVGDRLYGQLAGRLYLHAETLDFEHPATGEHLHFEQTAPF